MNAKQDAERLIDAVMPLAEMMLSKHGEFYPYGGYIKPDGEIVHVGAKDEDTDHPKSEDLLYVLRDSLSRMAAAGECKATAIVFDVRVNLPGTQMKSDAIQICVDHADSYSAEVFFPYEIGENGQVIFATTFAQEGKHEVFGTG